jgi:hypothetical protein
MLVLGRWRRWLARTPAALLLVVTLTTPGASQAVGSQAPFLTPGPRTLSVSVRPNSGPDLLAANDALVSSVLVAVQQVRLPLVFRTSP